MTATELASTPTTPDAWSLQLEQLRARHKNARPPVLAALNILILDANISVDDAKARAEMHGVRITAASLNAARTLLARMTPTAGATETKPPAPASAARTREPRRPRTSDTAIDAEALVRGLVAKLQGQGNVESDRLRGAMRRAIAMLQAAIG